jgi:hypothetical protein
VVETGPGGDLTVAWPNPVSAINRTVPLVGADSGGQLRAHPYQAKVQDDNLWLRSIVLAPAAIPAGTVERTSTD